MRATLTLLALLVEMFPSRGGEGAGCGQLQSNLRITQGALKEGEACMLLHAWARNRHADAAGCSHPFVLLWTPLSGSRSLQDLARLRTVLYMWSQSFCSLPPHLLCPTGQLRAGEGSFSPLLTLCSPLPLGEGMCWPCAPTRRKQPFLGSEKGIILPTRTMLPSWLGEVEEDSCA